MTDKALLAHPGTQYSHQLAKQLFRHGLLNEFWTGFALAQDSLLGRVARSLPADLKRRVANRVLSGVPAAHLRTMPHTEFNALRTMRNGNASIALSKRNRIFQERIPDNSISNASVVIGFDTSSWILAERARKTGKPFLLDQSIAHPAINESTARALSNSFPEWTVTIEKKSSDLLSYETREHELATRIIAASSFTKKSLVDQGVAAEKVIVNPYGVDLDLFQPRSQARKDGKLRFLFVGSVTARKGVPLLVKAWKSLGLKNAELWLVGPISPVERSLIPDLPGLEIKGKFPLEQLPELMKQCDVMVFPSYCEGFALVLLEALASGLPIITTDATAGPDLIESGVEGLLLPAGDLEALREAIKYFADDESRVDLMAVAARRKAERFSWDNYGDRWKKIIADLN